MSLQLPWLPAVPDEYVAGLFNAGVRWTEAYARTMASASSRPMMAPAPWAGGRPAPTLAALLLKHAEGHLRLWLCAGRPGDDAEPDAADRRFAAAEWRQPFFHWLKQSYALNSEMLEGLAEAAEIDPKAKHGCASMRASSSMR